MAINLLSRREHSQLELKTKLKTKGFGEQAIADAITASGASSIRDMGKVMGVLKAKYTGQLDFGKVGGMVKAQLS